LRLARQESEREPSLLGCMEVEPRAVAQFTLRAQVRCDAGAGLDLAEELVHVAPACFSHARALAVHERHTHPRKILARTTSIASLGHWSPRDWCSEDAAVAAATVTVATITAEAAATTGWKTAIVRVMKAIVVAFIT
jgi:hypothetical protein